MVFNESITLPSGTTNLTLAIEEGVCERKVVLNFLIIVCIIHLKITYLDNKGRLTTINVDLKEEKRIRELILKEVLASAAKAEEGSGNTNMFDLDTREDEVRPNPDDEFEYVQLGD